MKKNASSEKQTYPVTLHHTELGELGKGTLSFRENHWANVTLDRGHLRGISPGEKVDLIKAVVENGRTYSLCKCHLLGFILYADYFIEADIESIEFDLIAVRYSDISEWFLRWQRMDGEIGKELVWDRLSEPLSVSISTDQEQFDLVSEYIGTQERKGEDIVLHEHIEFFFSNARRKFNLDEVKAKTLELSCLLSILIAYPVTILNVYVGVEKGGYAEIHFPTFERPDRDMTDSGFWIKHLIQKPKIEDRWQTIFDGYYRSKYRKECWIKLSGMQRYEGFWEYKALGYISLLDRYVTLYCDQQFKSEPPSPSPQKMKGFQHALASIAPTLSDGQRDALMKSASRIFAGKGDLSFARKYNHAVAETDQDVIRIIAMSKEDFRLMIELRNKLAHGEEHGLHNDDFKKVTEMVSKIILLLTYWAFRDFGLTADDFLLGLKNTHNYLRSSAELDRVHLDRVTKSAEFFSVSLEVLFMVKQMKHVHLGKCFSQEDDGTIQFSEKYTLMYQAWDKSPSRQYGLQKAEDIFGIPVDAGRVVGNGYLECGDERVELHSFWIIDISKLPKQDPQSNISS